LDNALVVNNAGDGDSSRDANQKNDGSFYGVKSERLNGTKGLPFLKSFAFDESSN